MVMLGVRQQKYGCARPEHKKERKGRVAVANACGDVDAYVVHWDHDAVDCAERVQPTWDAIERCMRRMLPHACGAGWRESDPGCGSGVVERLYTCEARQFNGGNGCLDVSHSTVSYEYAHSHWYQYRPQYHTPASSGSVRRSQSDPHDAHRLRDEGESSSS